MNRRHFIKWNRKFTMKKNNNREKGFTIVEIVISIVILSALFLGGIYSLATTTVYNIDVDLSTTAVLLARGKMAEVTAHDFSDIDDVGSTNFGGDFSDYNYEIAVDYVDAGNLDVPVGGPTIYKRIVITVTASGWTGNIRLYDLKVDL